MNFSVKSSKLKNLGRGNDAEPIHTISNPAHARMKDTEEKNGKHCTAVVDLASPVESKEPGRKITNVIARQQCEAMDAELLKQRLMYAPHNSNYKMALVSEAKSSFVNE